MELTFQERAGSFSRFASARSTMRSVVPSAHDLTERVHVKARELGFDAVGIANAIEPLDIDHARYEAFLEAGMHGTMAYLAENREARHSVNGPHILEGAKSVICIAQRYQRSREEEASDPPLARSIARYARGSDYHNFLRRKLRKLAAFVRTLGTEDAPVQARPLADDAPILERAWAARAGLGFIGKNGLVIVPGLGSMLLIGEVVTTLDLLSGTPIAERCGSCTRCLDACPTSAFPRPFVLDAQKCLSYVTIEQRGEVASHLIDAIGEHLFGCDDCQTVCPFNASAKPRDVKDQFSPRPEWSDVDAIDLLQLSEMQIAELVGSSPLKRTTPRGVLRNACFVVGAQKDVRAREVLLALGEHADAGVRQAARWAITQLHGL